MVQPVRVTVRHAASAAPAPPLAGSNYLSAPPAVAPPSLRLAWSAPHPLTAGAPPRSTRRRPAPRPHVPGQPRPPPALGLALLTEGVGSSIQHGPATRLQFSNLNCKLGSRRCCGRREPPHESGHNCRPLRGRIKVGPTTLGATRGPTRLELENESYRGHRRGAGREPPWRGQLRKNLVQPERSVSSFSRVRGPAGIGG